jgi:energy-coupling factor transporter ATP-binding protein EcfA2
MKIEYIRIVNFRGFKDETIYLDDYTCHVGPNGAGKSTILCALNVFFREYSDAVTDLSKLTEEDFHHKNTGEPIRITICFRNLSEEAKSDLSDYVRQERLIVSAVARYDKSSERAEVRQYGSRLGFEKFCSFFEKEKKGAKVPELKNEFQEMRKQFPDLGDAKTKDAMSNSLRDYEAEHTEDCILLQSQDQFYGVSKGRDRLEKYIQWVFIPANKDATGEQKETKTSALGQLLARTVRSKVNFSEAIDELRRKIRGDYQGILDSEEKVLDELSQSLEGRLKTWAHPDASVHIRWHNDEDKSVKVEEPWAHIQVGEKGFEGELGRFGHGLQRSYIIALLYCKSYQHWMMKTVQLLFWVVKNQSFTSILHRRVIFRKFYNNLLPEIPKLLSQRIAPFSLVGRILKTSGW